MRGSVLSSFKTNYQYQYLEKVRYLNDTDGNS